MEVSVSLTEKKRFLRWFLKSHKLKKREGRWILNYLLGEDRALKNVKFIEHAEFCPRGLYLSCHGTKGAPLTFFKGKIRTTDGDKSFHDLRMNLADPIYLELDYKESQRCSRLALVKEENPYLPEDYYVNEEEKGKASQWLDLQLLIQQKEQLSIQIDQAIDNRDETRFRELSTQYVEVEKRIKNQEALG
ncbi:ReoY family proteolytic degradation factor [Salimicrobium halophilum]|uniref:UPF0302 protein SAMN04490247_0328 n=1 Tax=Salimicrobium halophilum TaxID=86666 RepID=A0A1G8Q1K2_9BACI|nr:ReoY family proteolytic degradation factor [Salimicrobium halophilum]SDI98335.1 Uncharacterized protein YpiB, UPF0302 family [Salimicrobium halophilum]